MATRRHLIAATLAACTLATTSGCGHFGLAPFRWPWDKTPAKAPIKAGTGTHTGAAADTSTGNDSNQITQSQLSSFEIQGQKLASAVDPSLGGNQPVGNWKVEIFQLVDGQQVDWNSPFAVTNTDGQGNFSFSNLPAGKYLVVDASQDNTQTMTSDLSGPSDAEPLDISHVAPYVNTPPPQGLENQGFVVTVGQEPCTCGLQFIQTFTPAEGGGPRPTPSCVPAEVH